MLQPKTLGAVALLGLLASAAVSADERYDYPDYGRGQYWYQPQVRLGVDVLWGGHGYAPPRPPVVWYPAYSAPDRYCDHDEGYGRGHHKHHHRHRWDDSDD